MFKEIKEEATEFCLSIVEIEQAIKPFQVISKSKLKISKLVSYFISIFFLSLALPIALVSFLFLRDSGFFIVDIAYKYAIYFCICFILYFILLFKVATLVRTIFLSMYLTVWSIVVAYDLPLVIYIIYLKSEILFFHYLHVVLFFIGLIFLISFNIYNIAKNNIHLSKFKILFLNILLLISSFFIGFTSFTKVDLIGDTIFYECINEKIFDSSRSKYILENSRIFQNSFNQYLKTKDLFFYMRAKDLNKTLNAEREKIESFEEKLLFNKNKKIVGYIIKIIDNTNDLMVQAERLQNIPEDIGKELEVLYEEIMTRFQFLDDIENAIQEITETENNQEAEKKIGNIKETLDEILSHIKETRLKLEKISCDVSITENIFTEINEIFEKMIQENLEFKKNCDDKLKEIELKMKLKYF